MTGGRTTVRTATLADVDAVAATVTAAFSTDLAWSFIIGPDNSKAMESFARTLLIPRIRRGTAWVVDDCAAVAMWDRRAVDRPEDGDHDEWWAAFRADVGDQVWTRLDVYDSAVGAAAPKRPYWYLGVLATHPDQQGRGLATAALEPGLTAADADRWDCWLETSTPGNKAFYASRGFTDGVPFDVPGGPASWWLRRPVA